MFKKISLLLLSAVFLSACNSYGTPASSSAPATAQQAVSGTSVAIQNFAYNPKVMTVAAGAIITFTNNDTVNHSYTSDTGAFDTGLIAPGSSKTFTAPATAGSYAVHCTLHPSVTGTLIVK